MTAPSRTRVAFVLRALPAYRIPLLRRLVAACPDFDLTVISGSETVAERGKLQTETSAQPFAVVPVSGRVWEIWKYTVVWLHDCITHLRAVDADVVIVEGNFGILSQAVVATWARWTGRRVIFWVAGWQKPWVTGLAASLRNGFMRLVLPVGHHSVCYSTAAAAMLRRLGVPAERVSVAQNTIDTEAIAAAEPASRKAAITLRRELGIGDRPTIGYVGALGMGKGVERLIELHAELRHRGHDVHTVIVGDGPGRRALEARAAGLEGVHFPGRIVSGVDPYFAMADVFVLPGLGGLAINQAMANRLPVLCTRADGTERDLVVDGVTGHYRDQYQLAEWADLVESLIRDPARRQAMAAAAQARVLAVATLTQTAGAFEAAIRNRRLSAECRAWSAEPRAPISVLMSTYAGEQASFLHAALRSCAEQVTVPEQIVLVVDGAIGRDQDAVIDTFDQQASERGIEFTVVRLPEQGGLARAMNHGLPYCRSDYVARMDSDDISARDRFADQWRVLRDRPEVDLVAAWQADFESDPATVFRIKTVPELHADILKVLRWRNVVSHPSIVFRKSLVRQLGGYRPIRYLEDYDLFMRLVGAGATYYGVQRPLIHVRVTDAQRFRRGGWQYAWDELRFRVGLYRTGGVSLGNLLVTGPAYFAFRLAPTWAKRSLYWFVRRGKKSAVRGLGVSEEAPLGSDAIGTVGRAVAERAAGVSWFVRGRSQATAATVPVPVLCYHRIVPDPFQDRVPSSCLGPDQFAAQLRFLKREGFTTLSLSAYEGMVRGSLAMPDRAVLITFDDGYRDFATIAEPIAAVEGATINLFLCTGLPAEANPSIYERQSRELLDHQDRYPLLWAGLSWADVRELRDRGVGLGFHSHRHESYGRLSPASMTADVQTGMTCWRDELGALPTAFAFPKGGYGACPASALTLLRQSGFSLLFSTYLGRTRLPSAEPMLDRIVMHHEDDLGVFERKLFGAYDWLGRWRIAAQAARAVVGR